MKYVIGADIGGTTVKLGLFTEEGELLDKWEINTDISDDGKNVLPDIAASIDSKLKEKEISKDLVIGAGFGVPGPVLPDGTVNKCNNLGWGVINIKEKFKELSGLDAFAGNDANVAALGEAWKGGGKKANNVVVVTLGTGVGGGVIINGKIITGANGAAGEIGHIPVVEDETDSCGCGKQGCLEQYSSANGLVKVAKRILAEDNAESKLRNFENLTAKDVCDCAYEKDELALKAIKYSMDLLGRGLASISCVADPEVFVIGGGLSKSGDLLLDPMKESFVKNAFHASRGAKFKLAELGNDAGIYGAAKLVLIDEE